MLSQKFMSPKMFILLNDRYSRVLVRRAGPGRSVYTALGAVPDENVHSAAFLRPKEGSFRHIEGSLRSAKEKLCVQVNLFYSDQRPMVWCIGQLNPYTPTVAAKHWRRGRSKASKGPSQYGKLVVFRPLLGGPHYQVLDARRLRPGNRGRDFFFHIALYIKIVMMIFFRISEISKIKNFEPKKTFNRHFLYLSKLAQKWSKCIFSKSIFLSPYFLSPPNCAWTESHCRSLPGYQIWQELGPRVSELEGIGLSSEKFRNCPLRAQFWPLGVVNYMVPGRICPASFGFLRPNIRKFCLSACFRKGLRGGTWNVPRRTWRHVMHIIVVPALWCIEWVWTRPDLLEFVPHVNAWCRLRSPLGRPAAVLCGAA